ncbi:hypothetical protein BHL37_27290 [Bacillus cereus]|nr:hypothetical protein BHL37_27290 [Bacillus cereus]
MSSIQEWSDIKLKYIAKINPSKSEISIIDDTKVTFLPMENILSPGNVDLSLKKSLEDVYSGYTYFKENDLIVAKVTPCFENGNIAIMQGLSNGIGFGTTELHVIRVNEGEYNKKFFYYALQADDFKTEAVSNMYGVGGLKRIPPEFVCNYKFKVPPIQIQNKVVEFIEQKTKNIQHLIDDKERLITLLEEKRQSMITEAVTKGLNPNVKMKDSGVEWIGEIPEHWECLNFRRLTFLQQGLQIAQEERFYENGENRLEYITVKSINNPDLIREYIENASDRVICTEEDVLLARTGATGLVVTNIKGVFHNNFFKINYDSQKITKDFLVFYLKQKSIQSHFKLVAGTTTIPDLNHGEFLSTKCLVPPLVEQKLITDYLEVKEREHLGIVEDIRMQIEKLKEYRQSLIYEAVTGKIDVRDFEVKA